MVAGWPLMSAATGSAGLGIWARVAQPAAHVTPPVTPAGTISPSPVIYTWLTPPLAIGLEELLGLLSPFRMAPCPWPAFVAKIPGAVLACTRVNVLEPCPRYFTWT